MICVTSGSDGQRPHGHIIRAHPLFVQGEPLCTETPLLGFRCNPQSEMERFAESLDVPVIVDVDFCSLESADSEGNRFEVYWEGS